MKRITAILLLLCLVWMSGAAGAEAPDEEINLDETETGISGAAPETVEDPDNGVWKYISDSLKITVTRFTEEVQVKGGTRIREYCVADIAASPEEPLSVVMTEPTGKKPAGYKLASPELIEQKTNPVFALSDDMYGLRIRQYKYQGVVIRNGEVMATKTRNSAKSRPWPNLDTLALYGDGSMKCFICDALTAEEYLAQGAVQVFAFGPVLLTDGEIPAQILDPKYYPYSEPRVAIGMVEPYHYVAIAVRGRPTPKYIGCHLDWLAEKMQEYGCTEALNLDGGETATMMFMGKVILSGGNKLRSQGSLITFGSR